MESKKFAVGLLVCLSIQACRPSNKSDVKAVTSDSWGTAKCFENAVFSEPGKTVTVYTYVSESDFVETIGRKPDIAKPEEWKSSAKDYLMTKMQKAVTSNQNIKDLKKVSLLHGYGVYAATDPMQSQGYGEYLIAFDIPTSAPYAYGIQGDLNRIQCPFFGLMYDFNQSATGNQAIVLRYDAKVHPQAKPIVDNSVRVYRRSWAFHSNEFGPYKPEKELLSGPSDLKLYGPTWEQVSNSRTEGGADAGKVFLDKYYPYLGFFSELRKAEDHPNRQPYGDIILTKTGLTGADTLDSSGRLNSVGMLTALNYELISRPQWVVEAIAKLRQAEMLDKNLAYTYTGQDELEFTQVFLPRFINRSMRSIHNDYGISDREELEVRTFVKIAGLIPESSTPRTVVDLTKSLTDIWYKSNSQSIEEGMKAYYATVDYWKKNNLDAFRKRAGYKAQN